jgi:hypothetical protein
MQNILFLNNNNWINYKCNEVFLTHEQDENHYLKSYKQENRSPGYGKKDCDGFTKRQKDPRSIILVVAREGIHIQVSFNLKGGRVINPDGNEYITFQDSDPWQQSSYLD